jgi:hypothetical protein
VNDDILHALYNKVASDSSIDDAQRNRDLETIEHVMFALEFGELSEPQVDRLSMIREIAEKKQSNTDFRKKLKAKSRKVRRNATEDKRSIRGLDAFDEKFMYSSDDEVRRFADGAGITDAYAETVRFDDEWN